jgi:hypothetical protein
MTTPMIGPDSPCQARVIPGRAGGISVTVDVPCYGGMHPLSVTVERDRGGDWVVTMPDTSDLEVMNGITYLGAPDIKRPASRDGVALTEREIAAGALDESVSLPVYLRNLGLLG